MKILRWKSEDVSQNSQYQHVSKLLLCLSMREFVNLLGFSSIMRKLCQRCSSRYRSSRFFASPFNRVLATAEPLPGCVPYLIIVEPQRSPRDDGVGDEQRGKPLTVFWAVQAQVVADVGVRDRLSLITPPKTRFDDRYLRTCPRTVADADAVSVAQCRRCQPALPHGGTNFQA